MTFWVAGAVIGSSLIGASASKGAAKSQAAASDRASEVSQAQYDQTREDMTPWREAGGVALGQLSRGTADGGEFNRNFTMGDFAKDPGYQFRMDEGQKAMERSAAARGGALSGGALKGLERYAQNFASGEYGNAYNRFNTDTTTRFNRLSSVAGIGQTANNKVADLGANNAATIGANTIGAGNAQASGQIGVANAINGGASGLQSMYTLNRLFPAAGGGSSVVRNASPYANYTGDYNSLAYPD